MNLNNISAWRRKNMKKLCVNTLLAYFFLLVAMFSSSTYKRHAVVRHLCVDRTSGFNAYMWFYVAKLMSNSNTVVVVKWRCKNIVWCIMASLNVSISHVFKSVIHVLYTKHIHHLCFTHFNSFYAVLVWAAIKQHFPRQIIQENVLKKYGKTLKYCRYLISWCAKKQHFVSTKCCDSKMFT